MLRGNSLIGFNGQGSLAIQAVFEGSTGSQTNLTTYTFSAFDIGSPDVDRMVVVCAVGWNASIDISSITIGGDTAALTSRGASANASSPTVGMAYLKVPSGNTADIVLTFTGTSLASRIMVYTFRKKGSGGQIAIAHSRGTATTHTLTDLMTTNGGLVICVGGSSANTSVTSLTWNGPATSTTKGEGATENKLRFSGSFVAEEYSTTNDYECVFAISSNNIFLAVSYDASA